MDIQDQAEQIVKSIHDAVANYRPDLEAALRADLAEINTKLAEDGFAPIVA